eukprot:scaffold93823_cov26-Tisochrysis_lutea.AAC.1
MSALEPPSDGVTVLLSALNNSNSYKWPNHSFQLFWANNNKPLNILTAHAAVDPLLCTEYYSLSRSKLSTPPLPRPFPLPAITIRRPPPVRLLGGARGEALRYGPVGAGGRRVEGEGL